MQPCNNSCSGYSMMHRFFIQRLPSIPLAYGRYSGDKCLLNNNITYTKTMNWHMQFLLLKRNLTMFCANTVYNLVCRH